MATSPIPKVVPARPAHGVRAGDDYGVSDEPDWRTIDWIAHRRRTRAAGAEVNYVDIGSGDQHPIVFIHGLGGQWQNWLENIPRFAQDRRVIALDLPGFGLSPMPAEDISIEFYGRVVADLCTELELGPCVVVGNSMGGYIASELAIKHPELVERLMLVSAAGVSQMDMAARPVMAVTKAVGLVTAMTVAQLPAVASRPRSRHWALLLVARHPSRLAADFTYEGLMKGTGKPGFVDAMRACLEYDLRDGLSAIGCPTIVVWGDKDMTIPVEDADKFIGLIKGSRKLIMKDTGHVSMAERPVTFNDHLQDFLAHEVAEGELEGELA